MFRISPVVSSFSFFSWYFALGSSFMAGVCRTHREVSNGHDLDFNSCDNYKGGAKGCKHIQFGQNDRFMNLGHTLWICIQFMMIPFATHLNMYSRISGRSKLQEKLFGDLLGDWDGERGCLVPLYKHIHQRTESNDIVIKWLYGI